MNKSVCARDLSPIKTTHLGKIFPDILVFLCFIVTAGNLLWYFLMKIPSGKFSTCVLLFITQDIVSILRSLMQLTPQASLKHFTASVISSRDLDKWMHERCIKYFSPTLPGSSQIYKLSSLAHESESISPHF